MMRFLLLTLIVSTLLAMTGCGERVSDFEDSLPSPSSTESIDVPPEIVDECPTIADSPADNVQPEPGVITYNTGDVDEWPPFDGPLHITLPPTEVPEQIQGPFALVDAPVE